MVTIKRLIPISKLIIIMLVARIMVVIITRIIIKVVVATIKMGTGTIIISPTLSRLVLYLAI